MIQEYIQNLGYTTINNVWETLTDKELAKHDLLMTFNIDKGECDWDPELGTSVHKRIFQKKTEQTKNDILSEIKKIFDADLRFTLLGLNIQDEDKGWIFFCTVSYLNGTPEEWIFNIDKDLSSKSSNGYYNLKD